MKQIFFSILTAALLSACAAKQANTQSPKKLILESAFNNVHDTAKWCFDALMQSNSEDFYDQCIFKQLSKNAAEVHKKRWLRISQEASAKVRQFGGISQRSVNCQLNYEQTKANCQVDYQLNYKNATTPINMPMVWVQSLKRWQIVN